MNDEIRKRFSRKSIAIALATAIGIASLALLLLPLGIEKAMEKWVLKGYFTNVEIGDIDFNPFTATLAIKKLTAADPDTGRIELEDLRLKFHWLPLMRKRFYAVGLSLQNGVIDLHHTRDGWAVAGLLLPTLAADKTVKQLKTWQWGLDHIDLRDIRIHISGHGMEETVTVADASIDRYYTWKEEESSSFRATANLERGSVGIDGTLVQAPGSLEADARIHIEDLPLDGVAALLREKGISSFTSTLGGTIQVRGTMKPDTGIGALEVSGNASLQGIGAEISRQNRKFILSQKEVSLEGSASATIKEKTIDTLSGTANVTATGFTLKETKGGKTVASVKRLAVKGISANRTGDINAVEARADEMNLFERDLSKADKGEQPYILGVKTFSVKDIDIRENEYHAGDTVFDSFHGWIIREKGGTIDIVRRLQAVEPVDTDRLMHAVETITGNQEDRGSSQKIHVRLGSLTFTNKSEIVYEDHSVSPSFTARLSSLSLHMGELDTEHPRKAAPFEFSATLDKSSDINISGTVSPLRYDHLTMNLKVKIKSLALPRLNPFLADLSSYRVKSGRLDSDVDWNMEDGRINSKADIIIAKLELRYVGSDARADDFLSSMVGVPLDTAVSYLRDSNGVVKLAVPIHGDIRNPGFDLSNAIVKATVNAIKSGVLSYYAPLGISSLTGAVIPIGSLWLAEQLIKIAIHVRFSPVEFEPAQTELSTDATNYLGEVVSRLSKKPDVRIVICGSSTMSDLEAMRKGAEPKEGSSENAKPPSNEEKTRLTDMARLRAETVRDFLIGNGIAADRLYFCEPAMDTGSEAIPRVELAI